MSEPMLKKQKSNSHVASIPSAVLKTLVETLEGSDLSKNFSGKDLVATLVDKSIVGFDGDGLLFGQMLLNQGALNGSAGKFSLDGTYQLLPDLSGSGEGHPVCFGDFLQSGWDATGREPLLPVTKLMELQTSKAEEKHEAESSEIPLERLEVLPMDSYNEKLVSQVHPIGQEDRNPSCDDEYDMFVIGAGAGGLVTSSGCARHGAKTALVEYNLMGGDCLNIGCVPSKALLKCARVFHSLSKAADYGICTEKPTIDFGKVMERMRRLRAEIAHMDSIQRFRDTLGVEVLFGFAKFTSPHTAEVGGKTYKFKQACIATGGSAFVPPIPGLADVPYLTNANLYNLEKLPKRFGVIGAGPIGIEMAQAFTKMGSQVTVLDGMGHILSKEDPDAAQLIFDTMVEEGTQFVSLVRITKVDGGKDGAPITVHFTKSDGSAATLDFDELLISTGRKPNLKGLGLEAAGVDYDLRKGVKISDTLTTTQPHIYAVGDAASMYQFTHMAGGMGGMCWKNALFGAGLKVSEIVLPWVTYTDPEVAHVGLYARDCEKRGIEFVALKSAFKSRDRNILDGNTEGYCKIIARKGDGEILGATIVGYGAGNMIAEVTLAILSKTKANQLAAIICAYPTSAEAITACGWSFGGVRMTPTLKNMLVDHAKGNL